MHKMQQGSTAVVVIIAALLVLLIPIIVLFMQKANFDNRSRASEPTITPDPLTTSTFPDAARPGE